MRKSLGDHKTQNSALFFLLMPGVYLGALFLALFLLVGAGATQAFAAAPGSVVINEIAWSGTKAAATDEWIELYNTTQNPVPLEGWALYEGGGATQIATLSGSVAPGAFYLIERSIDDNTVSDITADLAVAFGGNGLINLPSGEHLMLKDGQGNPIDEVNAASGWFAGTASPDYFSMERKNPLGAGSDPANWASNNGTTRNGVDVSGNPINGTPKSQNSVFGTTATQPPPPTEPPPSDQPPTEPPPTAEQPPPPTDDQQNDPELAPPVPDEPSPFEESTQEPPEPQEPPDIILSELLPNPFGPDGEGEFIELYNAGTSEVVLTGWKFKDASDTVKYIPRDTALAPGEYKAFYKTVSLNNSGDTIWLLDPEGIARDAIQWTKSAEGLALARIGGVWTWTATPTPNSPNIASAPAPPQSQQPPPQQAPQSSSQTNEPAEVKNAPPLPTSDSQSADTGAPEGEGAAQKPDENQGATEPFFTEDHLVPEIKPSENNAASAGRAVVTATRSGPSRTWIFIVAGAAALVLGIFVAFLRRFLRKDQTY